MNNAEMDQKVRELRRLRRASEELTAKMETLQNSIKAEMTAQAVDTLVGKDYKITWKAVQSTRFDSKAFKAAMPELYTRFTRPVETRRFTLI